MQDALILDFSVIFTSELALSIVLRPNPTLENELQFWCLYFSSVGLASASGKTK